MTTAEEVFNITMSLSDELDPDTGVIVAANTNDYKFRTPAILNLLQSELIKQGNLYNTYSISNMPAEMVVGSFDTVEFTGTDLSYEGTSISYGYYFEVDGEGTVYIEDFANGVWNILKTETILSTVTNFTACKGIVTPTAGATKSRIRFSGTYRYLAKNFGLYKASFALSKLPDYRQWILKQMPSDFISINQIVNEQCENYNRNTSFKWEGLNNLYMSRDFRGNMRIKYRPIPVLISLITDNVTLDDITARTLLAYGLGMELYKEENEDLYKHFKQRYEELKFISSNQKQPSSEETVVDFYGINNYGYGNGFGTFNSY